MRLQRDPVVATWYAGALTNQEEAEGFARSCELAWRVDGVHKWMAYDRQTGELVGRGGMSRMATGGRATVQVEELMVGTGWALDRLELGWTLLSDRRGQGYATEIGQEALFFAGDLLGASAVISYTEVHNVASRAVAERLGMAFVGEIRTDGLVEGQDEEAQDPPFAVYAVRTAQPRVSVGSMDHPLSAAPNPG